MPCDCRELKFAVLCNMLVAFMRIQNPAIIANVGHCVEQAISSLMKGVLRVESQRLD